MSVKRKVLVNSLLFGFRKLIDARTDPMERKKLEMCIAHVEQIADYSLVHGKPSTEKLNEIIGWK